MTGGREPTPPRAPTREEYERMLLAYRASDYRYGQVRWRGLMAAYDALVARAEAAESAVAACHCGPRGTPAARQATRGGEPVAREGGR